MQRNSSRPRLCLAGILLAMVALGASSASAAAKRSVIGQASGTLGGATIDGQKLTIGAPVFEGSRIVTGATDSASVLLTSKVVLKFDANTAASITEAKGTHVQLEQGNVEVFVAKRLPGAGAVALSDPDATIEALGTVFIAGYTPNNRSGWYCTVESTRAKGVSVKGKAELAVTDLGAGNFVKLQAGKSIQPPAVANPAELLQHLGTILNLDKAMNKRAGTISRQQIALTEFRRVERIVGAGGLSKNLQVALAGRTTGEAIVDSKQYSSVNGLVESGVISSSGSGNSGGGGVTIQSSGGFSDISVALASGSLLNFRLFDNGAPDGDQVALRVISNGVTVLNVSNLTLSNAGAQFSPQVGVGTVGIIVTALNEGSIPPNTGGITVQGVQTGRPTQAYSVNAGQTATLKVKTN